MKERGVCRVTRTLRRALGAGLLLTVTLLAAFPAQPLAGLLPPPPTAPGLPTLPLPTGGSGSPPKAAASPPRPSRSPPSRCAGLSAPGATSYTQSVFPCDFPDPMVLRAAGAWYAYGSSTGWELGRGTFPILRSEDLRHWQSAGDALRQPPAWSTGDLWSPSVIPWRGRFLLFYSAMRAGLDVHCVAVATASSPQGPFRARRRIACESGRLHGFIDPAPVAANGRLYLFFSVDAPRHSIAFLRLAAGGLRGLGRVHTVLGVSPRWGALAAETVEGPWPMRHAGRYYLFYSAGSWASDYRMAYAVASSPLGPYSDSAPVAMLGASAQLRAPGGGSVFPGRSRSSWLAFAAWTGPPGYALGSQRTLRIAPLSWAHSGTPQVRLSG
jgi:beta-xylosidase